MKTLPFDPLRIFEVLSENRVRFVVIGGIAGRLWGSTTVTNDLDICYARDRSNLAALAAALRDLKARLRGVEGAVPFKLDEKALQAGDHFTFSTVAGSFDCLGNPAGSRGYEALARTGSVMRFGKLEVQVASLEDLILMKRAAGRPKDRIELEILAAVKEEIDAKR